MNKLTLILTTLALSVGAFAQMGHHIDKNAKHVIACPVTGDKVDMDAATKKHMFADFKGNRYFFCCNDCPPLFKKNPAKYAMKPHVKTPAEPVAAVQKFTITVDNGFTPASITVKAGQPVQLTFNTKHKACVTSVVFKSLGIDQKLEDGTKSVVKFTPTKPGTIAYACPMNMFKGTILVK